MSQPTALFSADDLHAAFLRAVLWTVRYAAQHQDLPARDHADTAAAAYVQLQLDALPEPEPAPKPKPKRKRAAPKPIIRVGDAAAERLAAIKRAKTYAALAPDKLNKAAMRACDRKEELLEPQAFSALLYHTPREHPAYSAGMKRETTKTTPAEAQLALAKANAPTQSIHVETADEYALYVMRREADEADANMRRIVLDTEDDRAPSRTRAVTDIYYARTAAYRLLQSGLLHETRALLERIRPAEQAVAKYWGAATDGKGWDRSDHREYRAKLRAQEAAQDSQAEEETELQEVGV